MELLEQGSSPLECEQLYEESLWCLSALQDDIMQTGNPFQEEDKATIANCEYVSRNCLQTPDDFILSVGITRTKLRLVRCRARRAMNEGDRLKDALADQNLDEVRYLPPEEAKPT